ncbi:unnamed protein product [Paramecium sonneborni]|uniref:Uncharacterized protein n=1 Tax=Paramecium sonneborni TaxID=65129 RepID=A0A8S1QEI2_9CILI|nr:unnamed protein product [Paramecium sonneborni]
MDKDGSILHSAMIYQQSFTYKGANGLVAETVQTVGTVYYGALTRGQTYQIIYGYVTVIYGSYLGDTIFIGLSQQQTKGQGGSALLIIIGYGQDQGYGGVIGKVYTQG